MDNTGSLLALVALVFLLPMGAGLCVLQYFLSKQKSLWLGLIIPCMSGAVPLVIVLNMVGMGSLMETWIRVVATLVLLNIPTIVFLVIYGVTRSKQRTETIGKEQVDKMNIQDL